MLATAYAAMGRVDEADRLYAAALADLNTTLPFPYAWIHFGRGLMWAEQGQNPARAEAMYTQALAYVPEFAASNISLARLEMARGDNTAATKRISQVARSTNQPEALALLGVLDVRNGDLAQGNEEISRARQRFESLLVRYPLGFADHAAEFYLGPGARSRKGVAARRAESGQSRDGPSGGAGCEGCRGNWPISRGM